MTVFVVNEVNDDLSAALKFGEIRYINKFYVHGDELEQDMFTGHEEGGTPDLNIPLSHRLNMLRVPQVFNPADDYLLIAGDHLQLLAMSAMLAVAFGSFMVLRYDRKIQDYIPVRLHSGLVPGSPRVLGSAHIGDKHGQNVPEAEFLRTPEFTQAYRRWKELRHPG